VMTKHTNPTVIPDAEGNPVFVVIPYDEYARYTSRATESFPHAVLGMHVVDGYSLIKAWRKYKGLSQTDLAEKLGITQAAVAKLECPDNSPRVDTMERVAAALSIEPEQLLS